MEQFRSLEDVEIRVKSDPVNGKAMLRLEFAQSFFQGRDAKLVNEWINKDDARLAAAERQRVFNEDRDRAHRAVIAAEKQATAAETATRIAWIALGASVIGLLVAGVALFRSWGSGQ